MCDCFIFPTKDLLCVVTNLVFHQHTSAQRSAWSGWGAPKPSAARPTWCMWHWRDWLWSECPWQWHSDAPSADQENRAWVFPVLPQRRHLKTPAGSAERRDSYLFVCLSLQHAGTIKFQQIECTHGIFSMRDNSHWQRHCVFMDKGEEDTCATRWTYSHLNVHIPALRMTY